MSNDLYDIAVEFLRARPSLIAEVWDNCYDHPAGILFQVASPTGDYMNCEDGTDLCGDICEVAAGIGPAYTQEMTEVILEDEDIPEMRDEEVPAIKPEQLSIFAEYQRLFDLTWDRPGPKARLQQMGFGESSFENKRATAE